MSYEIIFDEKVISDLNKLSKKVKQRIFEKIISTKDNPFHFFLKLEGRPEFKLRVGNYRIIADISKKELKILVLYVGHRKKIYKKI